MRYTKLGNTVQLCVGCMSYGKPSETFHLWTLEPEKTQEIVGHDYQLGINC